MRRAILVLGMHRSGTSALTRVLSLHGATLPRHLIPPSEANERGFFESRAIWQHHEALLAEAGTAWHDPSPFPRAWFDTPSAAGWVETIAETVSDEFGDTPLMVIKDPRLCRLLPLWLRVLEAVDAQPLCLLALRHPTEVARSLARSEGIPERHGLLLWLDYLLAAERDSRDLARSYVLYPDLLEDWQSVVARIGADLDCGFPRLSRAAEADIEAFLAPELHHHQANSTPTIGAGLHPWLEAAWSWALEAAKTGRATARKLDDLAGAWEQAEAAFGTALAAAETQRRAELEEAHERTQRAVDRAAVLERSLAEEERARAELRSRLDRRREELAQVSDTARVLLRWVIERARGEAPAPASLRQALEDFAKAHPLEGPAFASAALQISDLRCDVERLERERITRAGEIERLATQLVKLEDSLLQAERQTSTLAHELAEERATRARERAELERSRQELRALSAALGAAKSQVDRLAAECRHWMDRASGGRA